MTLKKPNLRLKGVPLITSSTPLVHPLVTTSTPLIPTSNVGVPSDEPSGTPSNVLTCSYLTANVVK